MDHPRDDNRWRIGRLRFARQYFREKFPLIHPKAADLLQESDLECNALGREVDAALATLRQLSPRTRRWAIYGDKEHETAPPALKTEDAG
jgi:hypothetical protein